MNIKYLERLSEIGNFGESAKISIIDGYVDVDHPVLAGAQIEQANNSGPASNHGTAVTSIIAGLGIGLAPKASILSLPVYEETPQGQLMGCSEFRLAKAIDQARRAGCHLINVSGSALSQTGLGDAELRSAVQRCLDEDILIIAAIGNEGLMSESVPAALPGVLAVGANDQAGRPAAFNNRGHLLSSKAILGPGVDIPAALVGGKAGTVSGTSFAAPYVTGVAALVAGAMASAGQPIYGSTIRQLIVQTAASCTPDAHNSCRDAMAGDLDIVALTQAAEAKYNQVHTQSTTHNLRSTQPMNEETIATTAVEPASVPGQNAPSAAESSPAPDSSSLVSASAVEAAAPLAPAGPIHAQGQEVVPAEALKFAEIQDPAPKNFVHGAPPMAVKPQDCNCGPQGSGEKIFVLGQLDYDFLTEANLDYFTQTMGASAVEGTKFPSDKLYMAKFLSHTDKNGDAPYIDSASALTWILKIDGIPVYAIEPDGTFGVQQFARLIYFLVKSQGVSFKTMSESSADTDLRPDEQTLNRVEQISIAGTLAGEVRLYNGQVVPKIRPVLRGMFGWNPQALADAVLESDAESAERDEFQNFLNRVYYELRNRGRSADERAINYAATNAFEANTIFGDAFGESLFLNAISVEQSPVCRPDSDCWDVVMEFFNPKERLTQAKKLYRYTIDVSGIMPVTVGEMRSWRAY